MTTPTLQTHDILLSDGATTLGLMCKKDKDGKLVLKRGFRPSFSQQQFTDISPSAFKAEDQLYWRQEDWGGGFGVQNDATHRYQDATGVDASFKNLLMPAPVPVATTKTTASYASTWPMVNGTFETGSLSSWGGGTGWAVVNTGTPHGGTYHAKFNDTSGVAYGINQAPVNADMPIMGGQTFTVTAWSKYITAAAVSAVLSIEYPYGTVVASTSLSNTTSYAQTTLNYVLPDGIPASTLYVVITVAGQASTEFYVDDVVSSVDAIANPTDMGTVKGLIDFNASHYAYSNSGLWKRTANNWVRVAGSPNNIVHACADSTTLYLARGASRSTWYMNTSEAFTPIPVSGSLSYNLFLAQIAGVMYGVQSNSVLVKYNNITTPTSTATYTIGETGYNVNSLIDYNATNPVVIKENSAWYTTTSAATGALGEFINQLHTLSNTNTGKQALMWNTYLYIPAGTQSVMQYSTDTSDVGPSAFAERLAAYSGQVVALAGDERWLFAIVDNGGSIEIMKGHVETIDGASAWRWHPLVEDTYGTVTYAQVSTITAKRLWYGGGTGLPKYIPLPTTYGNPLSDTNLSFNTGVTFRTGTIDFGLPDDLKTFKSCTIDSLSLSTGHQTVKVEYKKQGDSSWTEVGGTGNGTFGTTSTNTEEKFFETGIAAVKSKHIQLQLTFTSDDTTKGFGVTAIRLYAVANPTRLGTVETVVEIKPRQKNRQNAEDTDMTHVAVVNTLMGWASTHPLTLTLPDPTGATPAGVTMEVKFAEGYPRQAWLEAEPNKPGQLESALEMVFIESRTGASVTGDADLVATNIKTGVEILGVTGTYDTTAVAPTAAQVISGKVAWANGTQITGTMATQTLSAASDTVAAGYYDATTLSAVDADLTAANIIVGKTIFGIAGSASSTATHDIAGTGAAGSGSSTNLTASYYQATAAASSDVDLASVTQSYTAGCVAELTGYIVAAAVTVNTIKMRLYSNGVQVAESAYITTAYVKTTLQANDNTLSGSKVVKIAGHNYDAGATRYLNVLCATSGSPADLICDVFAASVKVV